MQLITKRRMSLHAVVVDDVWPTGGPFPSPYLEPNGGPVFPKNGRSFPSHPLSSIVSCNFRYIESSDEAAAAATVSKKCREEVLSLALFDLYTLLSTRENHLPRAAMVPSPIYSRQFSPNSSSISLRPLINCSDC